MKKLIMIALGLAMTASVAMAAPGLNRGAGDWTTTYSQATGEAGTWSGIYDGTSATGKGWKAEVATGNQSNLTVCADVELFCAQTWANTGVYFHKAGQANPEPVTLAGTLTSNGGQWIGLVADNPSGSGTTANIFKLCRKTNYRGDTVAANAANDIALEWHMRDSLGSGFSPWKLPDSIGTSGADNTIPTAVWWLLGTNTPGGNGAGTAGDYNYEFRCTALMSTLQAAGSYEMDPVVVVNPEL